MLDDQDVDVIREPVRRMRGIGLSGDRKARTDGACTHQTGRLTGAQVVEGTEDCPRAVTTSPVDIVWSLL